MKKKIKRIEQRTWEDFVEDLVHRRSVKRICIVAWATRWRPFLPEIKVHAKKLRKYFKKSKKNRR
jgi:hypothetical protein